MELIINDKIYKIGKPKMSTLLKNIASYGKQFINISIYKFKIEKISKSEIDSICDGGDLIITNDLPFDNSMQINIIKNYELHRKTIISDLGGGLHSVVFEITYDNKYELSEQKYKQIKRKITLNNILA